ncbi:MAG: hypothetical protein M1834_008534 [Cirrosporium novae-zelandiae]|nr:MAG: hypothetical protein M1834_008534 [Cirrosporium novae-zelandiae]
MAPIVFSLVRFSYATNVSEQSTTVNWAHVSELNNLFAVFDEVTVYSANGGVDTRKLLKISRGTENMETLDLNRLSRETAVAEQKIKDFGLQNVQPPVIIVVRSPRIAIRYPLPSGLTRRFQMRFTLETDFSQATSILEGAGFILRSSGNSNSYLQLPPSQLGSLPSSTRSSQKPPTPPVPLFHQQSESSIYPMRPIGTVLKFDGTERSASATSSNTATGAYTTTNAHTHLQYSTNQPLTATNELYPDLLPNDDSQVGWLAQPTTPPTMNLNSQSSARRATAPVPQDHGTLSQFLPPRRELPFNLSKPQNNDRPPTIARSMSVTDQPMYISTTDLPALPKPTYVDENVTNLDKAEPPAPAEKVNTGNKPKGKSPLKKQPTTRRRGGRAKMQSPPVPTVDELLAAKKSASNLPTAANEADTNISEETTAKHTNTTTNPTPQSSPIKTPSKPPTTKKAAEKPKPSPAKRKASPKKGLPKDLHETLPQDPIEDSDDPATDIQPPPPIKKPTPKRAAPSKNHRITSNMPPEEMEEETHSPKLQSLPPSSSSHLPDPLPPLPPSHQPDGSFLLPSQPPKTRSSPTLAKYISQPFESRQEELETLFRDCIHDDAFLTLCEDVEVCWERMQDKVLRD